MIAATRLLYQPWRCRDWRERAVIAIDHARDAVGLPSDSLRHRILESLDVARDAVAEDMGQRR